MLVFGLGVLLSLDFSGGNVALAPDGWAPLAAGAVFALGVYVVVLAKIR